MAKLVVFTRERQWENWTETDLFIAENDVVYPEGAMRSAVQEFLSTKEGKEMIEFSSGDYNWGDAITSIPDETWKKHGIQPLYEDEEYTISGKPFEVIVNQDEVLITEEHQNLEEE